MARAKYKHDHGAFGRECLRAGFMVRAMRAKAQNVKNAAEALAPVGDPDWSYYDEYESAIAPGHYRSSFVVSSGVRRDLGIGARAFGRVTNTASYAGLVEYGYGRVPKHRVLGRALDAARL